MNTFKLMNFLQNQRDTLLLFIHHKFFEQNNLQVKKNNLHLNQEFQFQILSVNDRILKKLIDNSFKRDNSKRKTCQILKQLKVDI